MSFLLSPIQLTPAQIRVDSDSSPPTIANLVNPQPKVAWRRPGAVPFALRVTVDLGADVEIDTYSVLFHFGSSAALTWRIWARTSAQGDFGAGTAGESDATIVLPLVIAFVAPTIVNSRRHSLHTAGSPIVARYLRLVFQDLVGPFAEFGAGVLAIGRRWQPSFSQDWGQGRRIVDLSESRTLDGGEAAIWQKARVPEARATWSNLTDAELRDFWRLAAAHGESRPLLYVEDAALTTGLQERIHYGTMRNIGFYERLQSDKSRVDLTIRNWL